MFLIKFLKRVVIFFGLYLVLLVSQQFERLRNDQVRDLVQPFAIYLYSVSSGHINLVVPSAFEVNTAWIREPVVTEYPIQALVDGREGVVELRLMISKAGQLLDVEVTSQSREEFTAAAIAIVHKMDIDQSRLGAEKFPFEKLVRFNFVLDD